MLEGLVYGWRTAVLSVAVVILLGVAAALTAPLENRAANRWLALLLVVLSGVVTPWMIGFAGFYDKWRWLSFAPFSITLAVAPLFYIYIFALVNGKAPERLRLHLAPAAAQAAYLSSMFVLLRQPLKNEWLDASAPYYDVVAGAALIAGMIFYGRAGLGLLRQYEAMLARQHASAHLYAGGWLKRSLVALFILFAVWSAYAIWDLVSPLGYRGLMGLYLAIAAFSVYLAIEGWRHAGLRFPALAEPAPAAGALRDWKAQGEEWAQATRKERWHADPDLSLAALARLLGTNTGYLSRALNEGLGQSFPAFINRLRAEEVAASIDAGRTEDLLTLALEAGFSSKASFNRAFAATFGMAPSAYRREKVSIPEN